MAAKTTTKTTNDMIFATLRTKADKPAKYAEDLRALGYEVTSTETDYRGRECERDYWAVNGLQLSKCDDGLWLCLRKSQLKGLKAAAKVDFVHYLATLDARRAKAKRMASTEGIWQDVRHHTRKVVRCTNPEARWSQRIYVTEKRHYTDVWEGNETIRAYKQLRCKANGRDRNGFDDLGLAERKVKQAKAKVQEALAELERAQEGLAKEKAAAAAGSAELDAFLKARGIRK